MPRGVPWPKETVAKIALEILAKKWPQAERYNQLSERRRTEIWESCIRKAKAGLHDCYVLKLIEIVPEKASLGVKS